MITDRRQTMSDNNAIEAAPAPQGLVPKNMTEVKNIAQVFVKSGLFRDTPAIAQAIVKIMAGVEFGLGPFQAMKEINIIKGKVEVSAAVIAAKIKEHDRYDYRVEELTNEAAVIAFLENGEKIGESSFTIEDAALAELDNKQVYKTFPRNMLYARALTNGARWFCPDVFKGSVYFAGEIGGDEHVALDPYAGLEYEPERQTDETAEELIVSLGYDPGEDDGPVYEDIEDINEAEDPDELSTAGITPPVQWLIDEGVTDNREDAADILAFSPWAGKARPPKAKLIQYGKLFVSYRDEGEATAKAHKSAREVMGLNK